MKSKNLKTFLILLIILLGGCFICAGREARAAGETLHSVSAGGNWSDPNTWEEKRVPKAGDAVVISGIVDYSEIMVVSGLTVNSGAVLQSAPNYNYYNLTVNGNVVNNGTIRDGYNYFLINISGSIYNYGTWNNFRTTLFSSESRIIGGLNPLSGFDVAFNDNFEILNSPVFAGGVDFRGRSLTLSSPDQSITLLGIMDSDVTIVGEGRFIAGPGANISGNITAGEVIFDSGNQSIGDTNINADEVVLKGPGMKEVWGYPAVINGKLTIDNGAILQNSPTYSYFLTVNGDVLNNGLVRNRPDNYYNFYVNVSGSILNNGEWNNYQTNFFGDKPRFIGGNAIASPKIVLGGSFKITSDTALTGDIELNGQTLTVMAPNTFLAGGTYGSGTIAGDGKVIFNGLIASNSLTANNPEVYFRGGINGAVFAKKIILDGGNSQSVGQVNITADQIILRGGGAKEVWGYPAIINGNLIVEEGAILQNVSNYGYVLNINGDVENNGTIRNYVNGFYINISGNIFNNGSWTNSRTVLTWNPVLGAGKYLFNISPDQNNWPDPIELPSNSYDVSNILNETNYWRVSAKIGGYYTPWSEVRTINGEVGNGGGDDGDSNKLYPVIIVPGAIASYLNENDEDRKEIWLNIVEMAIPGDDAYLNKLALPTSGVPYDLNIIPTDIVRSILGKNFFKGLIEELEANGYKENENLFVFPYDWRLNIDYLSGYGAADDPNTLANKIQDVLNRTKAEKVDIVAHSMGGLVAKRYMQVFGAERVNKFIDIASPHLGAPDAFKILMYGDDLGISALKLGPNEQRIFYISQNFPSIYQLLPSEKYFDNNLPDYKYYVADMYDLDNNKVRGILDYKQTIDLMKNTGRNRLLLGYNKILHDNLDDYSPQTEGVKTYNIAGCGKATLGKIYILNKDTFEYEYGIRYIDGDGTVPLRSAESLQSDKIYYSNEIEHPYMPSAEGVRQLVVSILKGNENSFDLSDYPSLGASKDICSVSGSHIEYHSPIDIHIYDENNNHAGPDENGDIEIGIEGAQYDIIENNKFIFLPAGGKYRIIGKATDRGSFDSHIKIIENGEYVKTLYWNDVPLESTSTAAQMNLMEANQTDYILKIDQDGDNNFEGEYAPDAVLGEEESLDMDKPETVASLFGIQGQNDWFISDVRVELSASDNEGGVRVLKTEYSLDEGVLWQTYSAPLTLDKEGTTTILYRSVDRAGNMETAKEKIIKIDKSGPDIEFIYPQDNDRIIRGESLAVEYGITDKFSGLGSSTVKLNGQVITDSAIDLFYHDLGFAILRIEASDQAGNISASEANFEIAVDIEGVISDVKRAHAESLILKEKARDKLIEELERVKEYAERYGQKVKQRAEKLEKRLKQCVGGKSQTKCEEKLTKLFNKIKYKLDIVHQKIIVEKYKIILKLLDDYYKKEWITEQGRDIIKEDVLWLIKDVNN